MTPETILVVPTSSLWESLPYLEKGLITYGVDRLSRLINDQGFFVDRSEAEQNASYKQIIPYAMVRHMGSVFMLRRMRTQSEQRLHDKLSVGVGGHINPTEVPLGSDWVQEGLDRELAEELSVEPGVFKHLVGIINDDTTDVGRVHLGIFFELFTASLNVSVRETHKMSGDWVPSEELAQHYSQLETWSQIVYDSYLCLQTSRALRNGTAG